MQVGKVPPELLCSAVFSHLGTRRADVLLHAGFGEDSAAIAFGDEVCVTSTDPITGAGKRAGWFSVHIACNDVASNGAAPVGVLVTILLPPGSSEAALSQIMQDVHEAASELGIEVLGGHSEITRSVTSPVLSTTAIGRAPRQLLVTSAGARPGDALLLTKHAGLEGTAILAADFQHLLAGQLTPEELERARAMAGRLSVVREGLLAAELGAHAMHDVTEGGVLGATFELAEASGVGVELMEDEVPVARETQVICRYFGIDPLALVSSGCMLIAAADGPELARELEARGVEATVIGRISEGERAITSRAGRRPLLPPERDELWRVLEQYG